MSAQENAALARTVYEAFNNNEFDRALTYVSDDSTSELYALGVTYRGREGFREMMNFHKSAFPDGKVQVLRQLAGEDGVTNECVYRGTHTAIMNLPDGTEIPPTGKKIEIPFCEVWGIRNGKVISLHGYTDNLTMMQQIGLMEK